MHLLQSPRDIQNESFLSKYISLHFKFHLKNSEQQQRKTMLNVLPAPVVLELLQERHALFIQPSLPVWALFIQPVTKRKPS